MKRMVLVLLGFVLIVGSIGAQGKSERAAQSGPVTLKYAFWGNPDAIGVEQDIIEAFETLHPDIKIEPIVSGYADYHTKIMTMIAGTWPPT